MPLIKARTRGKQVVRHIARFDRENLETLYAYAEFLGEAPDYVLNEVIDTVLARDKEFAKWRAEHSQSFVPAPAHRRPRPSRKRRGEPRGMSVVASPPETGFAPQAR